jgi:ribonuclease E
MMNPISPDDDWNDLARELGVAKSPPSPSEAPPSLDTAAPSPQAELQETRRDSSDERIEGETGADSEPELLADEDLTESDDGTAEGVAAETAEGEPSTTGRKRRRRRRRRRKGGGAATDAAAASATATAGAEAASATDEDASLRDDESEPSPTDEAEEEVPRFAAEEDTASEVLRELIANWNVPSWDEIVSSLYRPN